MYAIRSYYAGLGVLCGVAHAPSIAVIATAANSLSLKISPRMDSDRILSYNFV